MKLRQERARIVAEEYKKAKLALATDLSRKEGDYRSSEVLKQRDEKLAEAQKAQAEVLKSSET